jgi:hypothetical protein
MTDPVVVGGPEDTNTQSTPVESTLKPEETTSSMGFSPIYVGGRKFNSSEELAEYTSELHDKIKPAIVEPEIPADPDKELSNLMFEDPALYTKIIQDRAEQRINQRLEVKSQQKEAWAEFYSSNSDLKDFKDIVQLEASKMTKQLDKLPLDQAMKELAKATRGRLAAIKGVPSGGVALPPGKVLSTGTSGGKGATITESYQPKNFVEQMNALRASRAKSK